MRIGATGNQSAMAYCFSHFIQADTLEKIVLDDIREIAQRIVLDEKSIRNLYSTMPGLRTKRLIRPKKIYRQSANSRKNYLALCRSHMRTE